MQWTSSSVWPRTPASTARSERNRLKRASKAERPAKRHTSSRSSSGRRARAGAASGASWPRRNGRKAKPTRASSSPRWRRPTAMLAPSTKMSTARAARWRIASRSASWTCSPTARRLGACAPISCGCGLLRWPMFSSRACAASLCRAPISPTRPVAPSAASCSRSVRSSPLGQPPN
jgi:hypothetical protein